MPMRICLMLAQGQTAQTANALPQFLGVARELSFILLPRVK